MCGSDRAISSESRLGEEQEREKRRFVVSTQRKLTERQRWENVHTFEREKCLTNLYANDQILLFCVLKARIVLFLN